MSDALQEACDEAAEKAVAQVKEMWQKHEYHQSVVDCPIKFKEVFGDQMVVRSSVYGIKEEDVWAGSLKQKTEIVYDYRNCTGDLPVHMRGSIGLIQHNRQKKYSNSHQARYQVDVVLRYLKFIRYTSFDRDKFSHFVSCLFNKVCDNVGSWPYHNTRESALCELKYYSNYHYWMHGTLRENFAEFKRNYAEREVELAKVKFAKHMWKIEQKLKRIDTREKKILKFRKGEDNARY